MSLPLAQGCGGRSLPYHAGHELRLHLNLRQKQETPKMPGLYLHIPFCKQACHYCDFHFSTSLALKGRLVEAIAAEIALRTDYLGPQPVIDTG